MAGVLTYGDANEIVFDADEARTMTHAGPECLLCDIPGCRVLPPKKE